MHISRSASIMMFTLLTAVCSQAQSSVWDTPSKSKQKAAKKLDDTKHKLKRWKDHVSEWGMKDSYKHELSIGGKVNSNGWSGAVYYLHKAGNTNYNVWQLSFSEIKHDKQVKQQKENKEFPYLGASSAFVFGKINNLYTLQLSYGRETLLLPGVVEGNLSVSFRYNVGFSLAMLKPYYLKLLHTDYSGTTPTAYLTEEKYTPQDSAAFLDSKNIFGASKWKKGLNELQFVPGIFGEAAFVITPGRQKLFIETVTLGINGAVYAKPLPIMADLKASAVQGSLFVGLSLGKTW